MVIANKKVSAERALTMGLVHEVYPDDQLEAETRAFCELLAKHPVEATAAGKLAIELCADLPSDQSQQVERLTFSSLAFAKEYTDLVCTTPKVSRLFKVRAKLRMLILGSFYPRKYDTANAESAHERGEQGADGNRGGPDGQLQQLVPHDLIDQGGASAAREKDQHQRQKAACVRRCGLYEGGRGHDGKSNHTRNRGWPVYNVEDAKATRMAVLIAGPVAGRRGG